LRNNEYVGSPCNIILKWRSRVIIVKCTFVSIRQMLMKKKNGNVTDLDNELVV